MEGVLFLCWVFIGGPEGEAALTHQFTRAVETHERSAVGDTIRTNYTRVFISVCSLEAAVVLRSKYVTASSVISLNAVTFVTVGNNVAAAAVAATVRHVYESFARRQQSIFQ